MRRVRCSSYTLLHNRVLFSHLQVIQIYKDPDGNPLRRGGKQSSAFSRGTPFTRSLEAIQNHAMIEEENKELRKQVEEVSFSHKIIIH